MKKRYLATCLFAGAAFLSGCSQQPPPVDDAALALKVKTAYVNDAVLFANPNILITSENGVITLTGAVPDQSIKDRIEKMTSEIKGVKGIKNEIEVKYIFTEKP